MPVACCRVDPSALLDCFANVDHDLCPGQVVDRRVVVRIQKHLPQEVAAWSVVLLVCAYTQAVGVRADGAG